MQIKKILFLTSLPVFVLVLSGCSSQKKVEEIPLPASAAPQDTDIPAVIPGENPNATVEPTAPEAALEPLPADNSAAIDSELKNIDATLKSTDASINSNNTPDSALGL
jgi:hypothetical protein